MSGARAVLRFSRDRRGYENFYLVQVAGRRGKPQSRVLYWFRTPPNVKIGRTPFDLDMQRVIESQNPNVEFDWPRLVETPIPPPRVTGEHWRERRRVERDRRRAQFEEEPAPDSPEEAALLIDKGTADADESWEPANVDASELLMVASDDIHADPRTESSATAPVGGGLSPGAGAQREPRRGRRRRGGRRHRGRSRHAGSPAIVATGTAAEPVGFRAEQAGGAGGAGGAEESNRPEGPTDGPDVEH